MAKTDAQIALECATKVYCTKLEVKKLIKRSELTDTADIFLKWLKESQVVPRKDIPRKVTQF